MRSIAALLLVVFVVGIAVIGCSGPSTDVKDAGAPTGDAAAQVESEFDNSLPDDTLDSSTSEFDSLDSDLASIQ